MKLVRALFAAGLLFSVGACNAGKEHVEAAEGMEKKMCACADKACVHGVVVEFQAWVAKNKATNAKATKDNHDKIEVAVKKMAACAQAKGEADTDKLDDDLPPGE